MKPIQMTMLLAGVLVSSALYPDDLMQVYHQAILSDQTFAQAQSRWQSQKMNLPIAIAGYLPQVTVTGNATRNHNVSHPVVSTLNGYTWQYDYQLTLSQPMFNLATWAAIRGASASVKAATATYLAAQQSLIQRTATAYFDVLQAYDQLRYTIANKRAVWQQFVTAREQFRVGLIAITDEYDARSRYDQVVAQQLAAQNNLNIRLENLREMTGHDYRSLTGLGKQLPLLRPQPDNIDQWVDVANQQNYAIKAQNYTVQAAMQTIKQTVAAGYPSLNLQGSYSDSHITDNPHNSTGIPNTTSQDQTELGLAVSYQPIQGGRVIASTKQARYNYVTASDQLEQTHRQVVNQTRSSFLSVLSYIGQVKADKESIASARNALAATEAGFKVGTRTMVDVLNDLTTLYQAQQQYANDQYSYINHIIALKEAAGTLSVNDLAEINAWLGKNLQFTQETSVAPMPDQHVYSKNHSNVSAHDSDADSSANAKVPAPSMTQTSLNPHHSQQARAKPPTTAISALPLPSVQLDAPRQTILPAPGSMTRFPKEFSINNSYNESSRWRIKFKRSD